MDGTAAVAHRVTEQQEMLWWARAMAYYYHHPTDFLTDLCYTIDPVNKEHPVEKIPSIAEKPHIDIVVKQYLSDDPLECYPKSRRMLITWIACALDLHIALWRPGAAVFVVSKNQKDSDRLVNRCKFIYDRLPKKLPVPRMHPRLGQFGFATQLEFNETNSSITALNENPDSLRQEGATLLHVEEFAFWKPGWAQKAYTAILPTIEGGGRARIICSAQAMTFFEQLVYDKTVSAQGV